MELHGAVRTGRQEDEMSNLAMMALCRDLWTIPGFLGVPNQASLRRGFLLASFSWLLCYLRLH